VHGLSDQGYVCRACLGYVMRKTGDWEQAISIFRGLIADTGVPRSSRSVGLGGLGLVHVLRGDLRRARPLLRDGLALAQKIGFLIVEIDAAWGLARLDELEGQAGSAEDHAELVLRFARESEDCHCPVAALRWSTTFFAGRGDLSTAGACVEELSRMAGRAASAEALAALAHAVAEVSLLDGDLDRAAQEFARALDLLRGLDLPFDRAETQLRAGLVFGALGERELAVERLMDAYRTARKLRARPLAQRAATELVALGEPADRRLGRRAAAELTAGGLSRRELEIARLVAAGQTNREIARGLFLSPRTVDMHVRNILAKLGCRSRVEATRKAAELGLLQS
jgi:ATP/maltotriose-dependent transcriptional regulator MalT